MSSGQNPERAMSARGVRNRVTTPAPRGQSTDRLYNRTGFSTNQRDLSPPRLPLSQNRVGSRVDFQRRSRTVSPSRRSNYCKNLVNNEKDTPRQNKDIVKNTTPKEKPKSPTMQKKNRIAKRDDKTRENKCIALIDEVCKKILEGNEQLNAADVKVLVERLKCKLMNGVKINEENGTAEPSKLYTEDSNYRIIKSEQQHQKVMMNCGIKKIRGNIKEQKSRSNDTTNHKYDNVVQNKKDSSEYIKHASHKDDWNPVVEADKILKKYESDYKNLENVTSKVSKKVSRNKKKSFESKVSNGEKNLQPKYLDDQDKIDVDEDVIAVDDLSSWKQLPDAVDKLVNYINDITREKEIIKSDASQNMVKKWSGANEKIDKMKSWDLQRRLTLGLKVETRALERNEDPGMSLADVTSFNGPLTNQSSSMNNFNGKGYSEYIRSGDITGDRNKGDFRGSKHRSSETWSTSKLKFF